MGDIQPLLDDIRDELSTDVYYVYQDTRNFLLESLAAAIATACLLDYIKGFVDARSVGEKHREYLKEFVEEFRNGEIISIRSEMDALDREANTLLKSTQLDLNEEKKAAAIEQLRAALIQIGMPDRQADRHAKSVADLVKDYLKT